MPAKTVATRRLDHPEIAGSVTEAAERLGYGIKL
jgi:hypothetical protein